jgi:hypothetical protein
MKTQSLNDHFIWLFFNSRNWVAIICAPSIRVPRIEWLCYMCSLEFQGPNGYSTCVCWSSKDWMATLHAFVRILGIQWLLYMPHQLEFQGLNGYYICVFYNCMIYIATTLRPLDFQGLDNYYICLFWSFWGYNVLRDAPKTFSCFNTWGTNLVRVIYVHLIQHKHCCWVSMWLIHMSICANMLEFFYQSIFWQLTNFFREYYI